MLLYYLKIVFQLDNLFNNVLPISAGDFAIVIPLSFILFILSWISLSLAFSDSNQLKDLLENKEILSERDKLAKFNLAVIDENYRWDKIVDQYESYFLKILNHK